MSALVSKRISATGVDSAWSAIRKVCRLHRLHRNALFRLGRAERWEVTRPCTSIESNVTVSIRAVCFQRCCCCPPAFPTLLLRHRRFACYSIQGASHLPMASSLPALCCILKQRPSHQTSIVLCNSHNGESCRAEPNAPFSSDGTSMSRHVADNPWYHHASGIRRRMHRLSDHLSELLLGCMCHQLDLHKAVLVGRAS
jgi:hypothetical protein